jgi:hypothetical protein
VTSLHIIMTLLMMSDVITPPHSSSLLHHTPPPPPPPQKSGSSGTYITTAIVYQIAKYIYFKCNFIYSIIYCIAIPT